MKRVKAVFGLLSLFALVALLAGCKGGDAEKQLPVDQTGNKQVPAGVNTQKKGLEAPGI